jgi:hypothetical protein
MTYVIFKFVSPNQQNLPPTTTFSEHHRKALGLTVLGIACTVIESLITKWKED